MERSDLRSTEQTNRSLIFDIRIVKAEDWPEGKPPSCISRGPFSDGRADIVKHPDCPAKDLADTKERLENSWKESHGIELSANALRFHRR